MEYGTNLGKLTRKGGSKTNSKKIKQHYEHVYKIKTSRCSVIALLLLNI